MKGQLTNELLMFEADHEWISENMRTILEQYAEQWIAVKNGQVIASDPDLASLLSKLLDPAHTCVEFITREPLEVQIELPDQLAAEHDALVHAGWFHSEEELVRLALVEFVRRHRFELLERFQREDRFTGSEPF